MISSVLWVAFAAALIGGVWELIKRLQAQIEVRRLMGELTVANETLERTGLTLKGDTELAERARATAIAELARTQEELQSVRGALETEHALALELRRANEKVTHDQMIAEATLRRAEQEQRVAQAAVTQLGSELLDAQTARRQMERDLAEARSRLSVDAMKTLFQGAVCSRKNLCSELLLFQLYTTCTEAADGLQRILKALQGPEGLAESAATAAIAWAQRTLARVLDSPMPLQLSEPGSEEIVYTKAMECYVALTEGVDDEDIVTEAIAQTKRCLNNPAIRKEAVRSVLAPLLNQHPDNEEFLNLYGGLLRSAETVPSRETREIIETALYSMPTLSALHANRVLGFLQDGFGTATHTWRHLGEAYSNVVTRIVQLGRLRKTHLDEMLKQVHGYIEGARALLTDTQKKEEYMAVCRIIVAIHNAQGNSRTLRPKNRHVVQGEPPVEMDIQLSDYEKVIVGEVQNFAVGDSEWKGGAWVVVKGDADISTLTEQWRSGRVVLTHPRLQEKVTTDATVLPDPKGHGIRVTWPDLSTANAARLQYLAGGYHITR